jgi:hypothetical protein
MRLFENFSENKTLIMYMVYFVDRCLSFLAFVLFLMAIVLSVLRYTDSDYPFGIFKLFFHMDYYPQIFVVWKQELPKFFCMYINIYLMQTLLLYSLYLHMYMHNVLYMYSVKNMYIINVHKKKYKSQKGPTTIYKIYI